MTMIRNYPSYSAYRTAWDTAGKETPKIPINVDIELASVCQLRCPFCFWSNDDFIKRMTAEKKIRFMDVDFAKHVINRCAKHCVPALKFNWRGESTLHPDFSEIIKHAKDLACFYDIIVNTNGNCPEWSIDGLMDCTKVIVSFDSFDYSLYGKSRVNGKFEKVISTISELILRGHENIWIRRVITDINKDEDYAGKVKETFGDKVKTSEHYCFERGNDEQNGSGNNRLYCGYPSQRLVVASNGEVFPCCVDYNENLKVGNLYREDLLDIWNSPKMIDLRKELKNGDYHNEVCQKCTSWMSYDDKKRECVSQ